MKNSNQLIDDSPFHLGEQAIQTRTGKREQMESFGRQVIRSFLPEQHRQFYRQLPFLVVGSVDDQDWPWASILANKPGFICSPDPSELLINTQAMIGDPLAQVIKNVGAPLGVLGIEMSTQRRNRMNGRISQTAEHGFRLRVDQSFGNCPQYIQDREIVYLERPNDPVDPVTTTFTELNLADQALINASDTFFVSSFVQAKERPNVEGVDVSHRGGRPGFVKVAGNTLTIPDYLGNFHFNTLGNFLVNPKAGLIFSDFATGDVLMLTGKVDILWEEHAEVKAFKGAERAWRFTLSHGVRLKASLPFRATFKAYSPNTLMTGDWQQVNAVIKSAGKLANWLAYRVAKVVDESANIRSFYLEPRHKNILPAFEAGQFLTIRTAALKGMIRTYTLSSAPGDAHYRISVKREEQGVVSNYLHDSIKVGDIIEAKAPRGDFFLDAQINRPAVLIAGGVGITPILSMARHIANEGLRTRYTRPTTVLHSAKNSAMRAFYTEFQQLEQQSDGAIRYYSLLGSLESNEKAAVDFHGTGRINADILRQVLALDDYDYDFYLCGPTDFMQGIYDALQSLGVSDSHIFAESFGIAALDRRKTGDVQNKPVVEEADHSVIKFTQLNVEQFWSKGDQSILEIAEQRGLTPEFSCRQGTCGSCAVAIKSGAVTYRTTPSAEPKEGEVLICCAVPAKGSDVVEIDL
jgi:ferredoxin-NADP reductase/predicted pyridoxine 5'-phosphate oxidase superfamily flavin-nucleotide-binding protein